MLEKYITAKTKKLLEDLERSKYPIVFYKASDRYTSGVPDYLGVLYSIPFAIELKRTGKKARKLQEYTLNTYRKAGSRVLCTDSFDEVKAFLYDIIDNHVSHLKNEVSNYSEKR